MSNPSTLSGLPASGGGLPVPDFLNAEIVGDGKVPPLGPIPEEFDFSIKQSSIFGIDSGDITSQHYRAAPNVHMLRPEELEAYQHLIFGIITTYHFPGEHKHMRTVVRPLCPPKVRNFRGQCSGL
ncbi:hypothetical protein RSAG8_09622, partial [Rhizoctonia solani AG-8 WAC10335]